MAKEKVVKDIMVNISKYPHVPYWFSISKAARIAKVSLFDTKEYPVPMALLVFDEKYNLMGTVSLKDILKEIEQGKESKKTLDRPVSEVMTPAKSFVEPGDPVTKASSLMIQNDLELLPVLENKKKFVGLVRIVEVFKELKQLLKTEE
ncbi:MAG: CBS domain-containing protein [Nitrospirae bacterium]|nr:CBS domain-containing protein [Nitrospirota bacterium]